MAQPKDFTADVNFLFEMGSVRFISRMWHRFLGGDFANLADHHFRMYWIAMVIAEHEGADINTVGKMVMVHDISESRAGDVDYLARQYVERNEQLAITDMLRGTAVEAEFLGIWQQYEDRTSLEAKVAKDADNLDVDFELAEQAASGWPLKARWQDNRRFVAAEKLYTQTAKQIFAALETADPHAWHLISRRNRRNGGDWQK